MNPSPPAVAHMKRSARTGSTPVEGGRRNVEQVWLQAPVFPTHGPTPTQPLEAMRRWSVADVSAFFESKDAVGLATTLSAKSVQGKDLLLLLTAGDLVADLRMTRFGARKALSLRDALLRG